MAPCEVIRPASGHPLAHTHAPSPSRASFRDPWAALTEDGKMARASAHLRRKHLAAFPWRCILRAVLRSTRGLSAAGGRHPVFCDVPQRLLSRSHTRRGTDAQRAAPGERRAAVVDGGGGTQSASTAWRGFCDLRAPADARLAWVNARAWSDAAAAENQTPGVTRVTPNQRASPKAADLPLPAAVPLHTTPGPFGGGRRPAISVPRPRSPIVISGLRRSQQGPRVFCHADRHGTRPGRWHDAPSKSALRGGGARGAHPVSARGGVPHAETCRNGCGPRTCAPPGACRPLRADPCPVTARVRGGGGSRGARLLEGGPARAPRAIRGASARARARAEEEEDRPSWRHSLCAPSNCTQCAVPAGSTTSRIWEGDWRWGTGHAARALQRPAWLSPPPLPCWMRVRGHCAGVRRGTPFCVRACRCSSLTCCCLRDAWYGMALTLWTLQPGLLSFEASRGVW